MVNLENEGVSLEADIVYRNTILAKSTLHRTTVVLRDYSGDNTILNLC